MSFRNRFAANEQSGRPGRLFPCALILGALLMFLAPVASSNTTTVEAEVAQDSTIYLPIVVRQQPATGPLSVHLTLDRAHSVQQAVPPAGGVLNVTGADGTKFSLAISDRSLPVTRTITMTVISAVQGLPFSDGLAGAVHLEPQGLLFLEPAILTIVPARPVPPDRQTFFAYDEDGQEFRLHPSVFDPANLQPIRLPVYHFSGVGMASGTEAERRAMLQRLPSDAADQIMQEVAALLARERAAQLAGQPGDPELSAKLQALFRSYYTEVVQPTLQAAYKTHCHGLTGQHAIGEALSLALGWERSLLLLGLGEDFMSAERGSISTTLLEALAVCWMDATNPCMDWRNPSQIVRVFSIAHQAQILGGSDTVFDPGRVRKCEGCEWAKVVSDWNGRVVFSYQNHSSRSVYGGSITADVARSATMVVGMTDAADWGGRQRWNANWARGSGNFNDRVVETSRTQTWIGSGELTQLSPATGHGKMDIDPAGCKYSVEFTPYIVVAYTNDSREESRGSRAVGTPYLFELPVPDADGRVLSGMRVLPGSVDPMQSQNTFTHFFFGGTGAAAELEYALGKDNLGTAQVEWSLSPAPYW